MGNNGAVAVDRRDTRVVFQSPERQRGVDIPAREEPSLALRAGTMQAPSLCLGPISDSHNEPAMIHFLEVAIQLEGVARVKGLLFDRESAFEGYFPSYFTPITGDVPFGNLCRHIRINGLEQDVEG